MNTTLRQNNKGFGAIELILILVAVVVLAGAGWYVWMRERKTKMNALTGSTSTTSNTNTSQTNTTPQPKPDPYAGWKTYSNSTYGISFRYPTTWLLTEGTVNSNGTSATKQEYAIGLKRSDNVKYNDTVSVEVLGEDFKTASAWYDSYYAQSPSNHVTKTSDQLKSKQSVQYAVTNSGVQSKLYLFSVGSKTYTFSSINESLNVQADTNYWATFNKVFDSLEISS
jgi:hypothetical protein